MASPKEKDMDLAQIKQALKTKSPKELKEVSDLCIALQGLRLSPNGAGRSDQIFYDALTAVVAKSDRVSVPVTVILKQISKREISEAILFIDDFLNKLHPAKIMVPERRVFYIKLLNLVRSYLTSREVPVSYTTLVHNIQKIPDLFEHAFPGYADSGLGHWALKPRNGAAQ